ncbi:hypothetical protein OsJ_08657 [Oryza sativa Japonica Group]|uniref:mitogen-activated protein kinase kinase n=1 Tax=Oryza sativa subsp. japonica TaxID=39947 RepID=A3AC38_ORYSJ|nr:hypothetical protein OsJ_08657 [Oryza sativa Japonica Group]
MRPGGPPSLRAGLQQQQQQQPGTPGRSRRRPDLTLPLPQRDLTSLAVPLPLPLPPSSAPSSTSSSGSSSLGGVPPRRIRSAPRRRPRRRCRSWSASAASGAARAGRCGWCGTAPRGGRTRSRCSTGTTTTPCGGRSRARSRSSAPPSTRPSCGATACTRQAGELQILLEYMDGGSLEGRRIASEAFLADVARQVLSGIAYLHRRHIVHRDIKPSNLLIDSGRRVKIADFGVGRILNQTMDPCNSSVGTIAYMSPERINTDLNDGAYDGYAGDIWSFGLSILEFYMGRFPLGENLGKQGDWAALMCAICYSDSPAPPPNASPEFKSFISCCLQKNPARRPSAAQLLQHRFVAGPQQQQQPQPQPLAPPPS